LSTNATRALYGREQVILGAVAVEIQTEERNGLLLVTSLRRRLRVIPRYHTEIVGEDGSLSGLVRVEVVDDRATVNKLKGAIRILEVQLREPVRGLVLLNATRGTLGFPEVIRRRYFDSEVGTADDSMDMARDSVRAQDGVSTFNDKNVGCWVARS
jgi:hypothetical protein